MFSDLLFNIKTKNNNFYKKRLSLQDFPYRRLYDEAMKYKTKLKTQMTSRLNLCPVNSLNFLSYEISFWKRAMEMTG